MSTAGPVERDGVRQTAAYVIVAKCKHIVESCPATTLEGDHRIRNIWFPVCGQFEPTGYLARLSRYGALKILGSRC